MDIVSKWECISLKDHDGSWSQVEFRPVYPEKSEENKRFWDATPSGTLTMNAKPEVLHNFEVGKEYYLTFTPALE